MDSMSDALDKEMKAYEKSTDKYIKSLRESIKDTETIINKTLTDVLVNADTVLETIQDLSDTYKFKLDPNLTEPWENAALKAENFKERSYNSVNALINDEGIITSFGSDTTSNKLTRAFGEGSSAASQFSSDVSGHMEDIDSKVKSYTSPEQQNYLGSRLKYPWEDAESAPKHWSEESQRYMSQEVVGYAEKWYKEQLKSNLDYPWNNATAYTSWGNGVQGVLDSIATKSEEVGKKIVENVNVSTPSYDTSSVSKPATTPPVSSKKEESSSSSSSGNKSNGYTSGGDQVSKIGTAQGMNGVTSIVTDKTVNGVSYTQVDGVWYKTADVWYDKTSKTYSVYKGSVAYSINGSKASSQFGKNTRVTGPREGTIYKTPDAVIAQDNITGLYYVAWSGTGSGANRSHWIKADTKKNAEKIRDALKSKDGWKPAHNYNGYYKKYAKGTLGTKKDEWAITDEIGDELVMYATPEGRLSYMRAGSTVVPHDLTKELINIGEVGLDGLRNMPQFNSGVNVSSNYISKPEFNLTFDALVKAERIDENTLPEVKKFVQQEINSLVKQMNYAIKGKGGR